MAGCSAELTMVTIVAAEWTGIPQPVGTTAIAATANPLVRMKWEVRRRVRHPEQISQVCSQSDRKLTNVQKPLDGNRQGRRRQRHGAQVLTSDSSHPTKSIALTTVGCRGQVPGTLGSLRTGCCYVETAWGTGSKPISAATRTHARRRSVR